MQANFLIAALLLGLAVSDLWALYKIKPIQTRPALQYSNHQDFQNIVIGAYPAHTKERVQELFDADKLHEKGILPVLIVVENNNDFPIGIHEEAIYLVRPDRTTIPTVPFYHVVLSLHLDRPLSEIGTRPDVLIGQIRNRNMLADFEQKAFGEMLLAPKSSDYGVVFFPLPEDLEGSWLYLPEIYNLVEGEQLIFFEFELSGAAP